MGGPNTLSTEPRPQRIHLSGLSNTVSAKDLIARFSSFGNGVVGGEEDVGGLGLDALGQPRRFAFLTLDISDKDLSRCTSLLNGSMWKGSKLKIAPAKADYKQRIEAERAAALLPPRPAKRKRNPDPLVGTPARHFELVTSQNIKKHRGWTLDESLPSQPTPIFPLVIRPSHPLPDVPKAATTSWTRGATKAKLSKEARAALRAGVSLEKVTTRAKRVRIDPRRWGRQKVVFTEAEVGAGWEGRRGVWECEEPLEGEPQKADEVTWVFKTRDGVVRRRETTRLTKVEISDRFTTLLDRMIQPKDRFKPKQTATVQSAACAAGPSTYEIDDIFGDSNDEDDAAEEDVDEEEEEVAVEKADYTRPGENDTSTSRRAKSLSPPPYISVAPRALLYNEDDAFHLLAATQEEDEVLQAREEERLKQLAMLQALLGEEVDKEARVEKRGAEVEGFAGEESDDEDVFKKSMQLRGGGASSDESADSSDDTTDDDSSDEAEPIKVDAAKPTASATAPAEEKKKTQLEMGQLKDMFKPQEAASFSMLSGLDLDLEPLERTPSPEPVQPHRFVPVPAPYRAPVTQARGPSGPQEKFFFFPMGHYSDRKGDLTMELVERELGWTAEQARARVAEDDARLDSLAAQFVRKEGDTAEAVETRHLEMREKLRGQARKRHREAVKKAKGKIYGRSAGGGGGGGGGGSGGGRRGELEGREA